MATRVVASLSLVGALMTFSSVGAELQQPQPLQPPLRLTPLLEAGNVTGARAAARAAPLAGTCCESYSGFLTVDGRHDANLFFWFFPAEERRRRRAAPPPLVVWLQGGPGTSLMRPVFLENGPYRVDPRYGRTGQPRRRKGGAFTRTHSVLYFDSPVGTGYSFVRDPAGLAKSGEQVSAALAEALRQFLLIFPDQQDCDLYIAGESYGGKMATGLAHRLLLGAKESPRPKGLIVVNALIEAESQLDKSELAYQLGLVDAAGRDEMRDVAADQLRLARAGNWAEALKLSRDECGSGISPEASGYLSLTNLLLWNGTQDDGFDDLAQSWEVRRAIHVGNSTFNGRSRAVAVALKEDIGVSVLPLLGQLADRIRVLVVNGQLDLCMPYRLTADFLAKMKWRGAPDMTSSTRVTWCERGQLAGYARTVHNLTHVMVRNAGHYLSQDQPRWAADMLARFTAGHTFASCVPWALHGRRAPQAVNP